MKLIKELIELLKQTFNFSRTINNYKIKNRSKKIKTSEKLNCM